MRLLLALVLLAACGPKYPPQPSIQERCQAAPDPRVCEVIGSAVAAEVDAEMAAQYQYQAQPSQRVFIRRWLVPGGRNNPAPIGFIDE